MSTSKKQRRRRALKRKQIKHPDALPVRTKIKPKRIKHG